MNSYVVETYCRPKYQYMHQYFHHFLIMLDPFTEEEFAAMYVTEYRMLPRSFFVCFAIIHYKFCTQDIGTRSFS